MAARILLHIGYHKTATTWMQSLLFTPEHGYRKIASHEDVFAHVVKPHGLRFDPAPMRDLIARNLADLGTDEVPVISSEILSGHPFQGGHESDVYAERLHRIAPEARILISVRNQMRILPSVYMQYVLRGGTMPHDLFFEGAKSVGYFGFTPEHFEYDLLVAHYQRLFGRESVYILTQERLQKDLEASSAALAVFAGNRRFGGLQPSARRVHAASYPEFALPVLRRLNHVQCSALNPTPVISIGNSPSLLYRATGYLARRPPFKSLSANRKPVSDYVRNHFAGYYRASNARLAGLPAHPIDLSGYP